MRPNLWESWLERAQGCVAPEGKTHTAQGPCSPTPGQLLPRTSAPKRKPLRNASHFAVQPLTEGGDLGVCAAPPGWGWVGSVVCPEQPVWRIHDVGTPPPACCPASSPRWCCSAAGLCPGGSGAPSLGYLERHLLVGEARCEGGCVAVRQEGM